MHLATGSSRGIGLEIVKQLLADSSNLIFATCRNPDASSALQSLKQKGGGRMHTIQLDADDKQSVNTAARAVKRVLGTGGLDYLLINAGIVNSKLTSLEGSGMPDFYSPEHGWRDATQPSPCGIGHDEDISFECRRGIPSSGRIE